VKNLLGIFLCIMSFYSYSYDEYSNDLPPEENYQDYEDEPIEKDYPMDQPRYEDDPGQADYDQVPSNEDPNEYSEPEYSDDY